VTFVAPPNILRLTTNGPTCNLQVTGGYLPLRKLFHTLLRMYKILPNFLALEREFTVIIMCLGHNTVQIICTYFTCT